MSTVAYLFLIVAVIGIRAAMKGRATNIGQDLTDTFIALIRGDASALKDVASRTGDATTAVTVTVPPGTPGTNGEAVFASGTGGKISAAAKKLGANAVYGWGATGPHAYDCSGLMWRACIDAGAYHGTRFTTLTIGANPQFTKVTSPAVDDLVVWTGSHMGVVTGTDEFYSARSYTSGIGTSKISSWSKRAPVYYRTNTVVTSAGGAGKGATGGGSGSW